MLSTDDLRVICDGITYRPGWSVTVLDEREGPCVRIVAPVVDASNPARGTWLGVGTYPSPNDLVDRAAFLRWLAWRLQRVEVHESREFLRFHGELVDDPHAPLTARRG